MSAKVKPVSACVTRRQFLLAGGVAASTILLPIPAVGGALPAQLATYPEKKIGAVSRLKQDVPVIFMYPYGDIPYALNLLVKLGTRAAGGVGPDEDIVAFNTLCPHMGGDLSDVKKAYKPDHKVLGACPLHLSTYDLTRHGMVVAGHATQSLVQVVLAVQGDDIYATGMLGLVYGKPTSLFKV